MLGIANGTPANAASSLTQERFAAHLGRDETMATPGTPAQLYAMWWELFGGPPPVAVASPNGFSFADGNGQTIELTGFVAGPDGQVSDLVSVPPPAGAPTCNQLANVVSIDAAAPVVGQSPNVTFTRAAELRLLRNSAVRFVGLSAAQPITSITSPAGEVRFNDRVAGIVRPGRRRACEPGPGGHLRRWHHGDRDRHRVTRGRTVIARSSPVSTKRSSKPGVEQATSRSPPARRAVAAAPRRMPSPVSSSTLTPSRSTTTTWPR